MQERKWEQCGRMAVSAAAWTRSLIPAGSPVWGWWSISEMWNSCKYDGTRPPGQSDLDTDIMSAPSEINIWTCSEHTVNTENEPVSFKCCVCLPCAPLYLLLALLMVLGPARYFHRYQRREREKLDENKKPEPAILHSCGPCYLQLVLQSSLS